MSVSKKKTKVIALFMAGIVCLTGLWSYESVYAAAKTNEAAVAKSIEAFAADGWDPARECYWKDGQKVQGWFIVPDDGNWYFFAPPEYKKAFNLRMFNEMDTGKYYELDLNGIGNPFTGLEGKYYYLEGFKYAGFKLIDGHLYYFSKTTYLMKTSGYKKYKNRLYKFRSTGIGKLYSGVYKSYYYARGIKITKYKNTIRKMNNGKIYYFKKNAKVYKGTGWKRFKGSRYYFKKGVAHTGWRYVKSYKYYFGKNGKMRRNLFKTFGKKWKKKKFLIKVNRQKNCITVFAKDGDKGYTIPSKAFVCSTGKAGTPTIKGTFYLTKGQTFRWKKLGSPAMGGYCYGQYCSRINGSFLFHSVLYNRPNKRTLMASSYNRLGNPASHGCIRLQTINAKLIYDITQNNTTKVKIYDSKKVGPFGKPKIKRIPGGQNYDPTDPNI